MNWHTIGACGRRTAFRWTVIGALACTFLPSGDGQQPHANDLGDLADFGKVRDLANDVAQKLEIAKVKSVAVFDFAGPDRNVTALGTKLADDFSAALKTSDHKLRIESRDSTAQSARDTDHGLAESLDPSSMLALASYLDLNGAVFGAISREKDHLKISVRVTQIDRRKDFHEITANDVNIPLSEETRKLVETIVASQGTESKIDKTIPAGGTQGYSFPSCVYCPAAQYAQPALNHRIQGTVMLWVIVNPDGHAADIKVLKHLPGGLSDRAVETVEQWRFRPAKDHDGNPAAVRQIIEVTFHLY